METNMLYISASLSGFIIFDVLTTRDALLSGKFYERNPILSIFMRYLGMDGALVLTHLLALIFVWWSSTLTLEKATPVFLASTLVGVAVVNNFFITAKERLDVLRGISIIFWNLEKGYHIERM